MDGLTLLMVLSAALVAVAVIVGWGVFIGRREARNRRVRNARGRLLRRRRALATDARPRAAVIINPTKLDSPAPVRSHIVDICMQHGWADPLWFETTIGEPGTTQAQAAVSAGVSLVCVIGGDGTVRAVAAALVDTGIPLGLLSGGTGNLLARNLNLPVDSLEHALHVALAGTTKAVDVGVAELSHRSPEVDDHDHGQPAAEPTAPANPPMRREIFLVMAGIGFDATVVAEAPPRLKAKVGAAAYVVSGMRNLYGPRFAVHLALDGKPTFHRRVRSVIVGNCGRLQGGIELLPDATIDDGWLDMVLLSPTGVVGWAAVLARVVTKKRRGHRRIDHHRCHDMELVLDQPQEVQLDGDLVGPAELLQLSLRPGALLIRVE